MTKHGRQSSHKRQQARRTRMWRKDPRCRRCARITVLPADSAAAHGITDLSNLHRDLPVVERDRMATIQHLVDKFDPRRLLPKHNEIRWELWCWRCNFEEGQARVRSMPIEEIRARSAHARR